MRVIHLGAFGWGDQNARRTWCDSAASIWPNAGEREGLRAKCMADHVFDPWTAVGKVSRGLPLNWSTNPSTVGGGAVNAGIGIVNEAGNQVNQTLNPPVTQTPPPQVTPGGGTVVDTGGGSIMFPGTGTIVAGARSNAPLIAVGVLGLGALAFLALKKKRPSGALSGYGGRNRRRRRR